jgi:alcohol dehydrogenase (cytochrome c)
MLRCRSFCARVFASALALLLLAGKGFGQQAPPATAAPMPAILRNYQPVTAERLMNPEANSWLMIRRTYDGWGYSPLAEITANNVA